MKLLDIGCGTAKHLANTTGEIHAIDVDSESIEIARKNAPHVHYVIGKGEALPYPDEYFDCVCSGVALPYTNIPAVLEEMRRVVKPAGKVEFSYHPFGQVFGYFLKSLFTLKLKPLIFNAYALINGFVFSITGRMFAFPYNGRFESFQTRRALIRAMTRAGLIATEARARTPQWAPRIIGQR
jgi:ubiquinone/menaquinone biosynthesis C-methylase UbiE